FAGLEREAGADQDLLALKRKMGLAPPEPPPAAPTQAEPAVQARVQAPAAGAERAGRARGRARGDGSRAAGDAAQSRSLSADGGREPRYDAAARRAPR